MRSKGQAAVLILIVFATLMAGCTIDTLGLGEAILKVLTPKAGSWAGTTSQNKSVTYTVGEGGTQIEPGMRVGFFCQESWGTVSGYYVCNISIPIEGNKFDYDGSSINVGGTFGSTSTCTGTFSLAGNTGYPYYLTFSASGTWNTTWQSAAAKNSIENIQAEGDGIYLEQKHGDSVIKMVVHLNK